MSSRSPLGTGESPQARVATGALANPGSAEQKTPGPGHPGSGHPGPGHPGPGHPGPGQLEPGHPGPGRRRARRWAGVGSSLPSLAAIAVYVAAALVMEWRIWSTNPTANTLAGPDQYSYIWAIRWLAYALTHGHNPLYTDWINFPVGANLVQNIGIQFLGLLALPITLSLGAVTAYNVLSLVALAGSATAAYFLARVVALRRAPAFAAGLVYGFSPYMIAQGPSHLNLAFAPLPPLIYLLVHRVLVRQRGRPWAWGVILGLVAVAQFFVSSEILVSTAVICAIGLVALAVVGRRALARHARYAAVALGSAALSAGALLAYPAWVALKGPAHIAGKLQLVPQGYRADLAGLVAPDRWQLLAPAGVARYSDKFSNSFVENGEYLGVTLVLVLVIGALALRKLPAIKVAGTCALGAFVLSLGGALSVYRPPRIGPQGQALGLIPLPEAILTKSSLLANAVPARYALHTALFAALMLAVICERSYEALAARLGRRSLARSGRAVPSHYAPASGRTRNRQGSSRHRGAGVTAAGLSALLCGFALFPLIPAGPYTNVVHVSAPAYFTSPALRRIPKGSGVLIFPLANATVPNTVLWQVEAQLRFKTEGGNLLEPGPNGKIAFSSGPLSYTEPNLVNQVLVQLYDGHPLPLGPSLRANFQAELQGLGFDTVVAVPAGPDAAKVGSYLTYLLGRPPTVGQGALAWYNTMGNP